MGIFYKIFWKENNIMEWLCTITVFDTAMDVRTINGLDSVRFDFDAINQNRKAIRPQDNHIHKRCWYDSDKYIYIRVNRLCQV